MGLSVILVGFAQYPVEKRDQCKLMCIDRKASTIKHEIFSDIIDYLHPGDVLVINNTRVFPARIYGNKRTGAKIEVLLLRHIENCEWQGLVRPGRKFRKGDSALFADGKLEIQVTGEAEEGIRKLELSAGGKELFDLFFICLKSHA